MKTFLKVFSLLVVAAVSGCDDSVDRFPAPTLLKDYTVYSTKGSPALIYCRTYFPSAYRQQSVQFRIVTHPSFGSVRVVNDWPYNPSPYFYYEPNPQASNDEDLFVVEMLSAHGKKLATTSFLISSVDDCEKGPLVTYARIQKNTTYSLDLLNNDLFCNVEYKDAAMYARGSKNGGGLYQLDDFNSSATFSYTPRTDFTGVSEFYYDLGLNPNPKTISWDNYMLYNWFYHPEIFERYVSVRLVVEVVE